MVRKALLRWLKSSFPVKIKKKEGKNVKNGMLRRGLEARRYVFPIVPALDLMPCMQAQGTRV